MSEKTENRDELGPLPETDVRWVDGKDQWGYDEYSSAYSEEAMRAYAAEQVAVERERCAKLRQALLKCKTCALPTEVRDLVNAALRG